MAQSHSPLAGLRHDLRTPINHILGYSELLEEDLSDHGYADLEDLHKIQRAARELLDLVSTRLTDAPPDPSEGEPKDPPASREDARSLPPDDPQGGLHPAPVDVTGKILVVDDNAANRELLAKRLERQGHRICEADNGQSALEALARQPFDLVLLDVMMPVLDGYSTLRSMKADPGWRHIPVIMISALDEIGSVVRCIEAGAEDYLPKPFEPTLLRARIGASLEKKALRDAEQAHLRTIEETQRRLEAELREAARYVASILPQPMLEPLRISWAYEPSTELGGDSFGYHWIDEDHLAIYLLDVCGHGVGAALLSVAAINVIRSGALSGADPRDPGKVLASLNDAFQMERHNDMYFTIWYGVYETTSRNLRYASGGHPPALLLHPDGATGGPPELSRLQTPGMLIGGMPGLSYASSTIEVPPRARLFVYCDGAYEITRPDGSMLDFDEDFLPLLLQQGRDSELPRTLLDWIRRTGGRQTLEDDYSFIAIDFPEESEEPRATHPLPTA